MTQELFGGFTTEFEEILQRKEEPFVNLCDNIGLRLYFGSELLFPKCSPFLNSCKMSLDD